MDRNKIIALFNESLTDEGNTIDKMSRRRANFAVSHFCNNVEYALRDYLDDIYGEDYDTNNFPTCRY